MGLKVLVLARVAHDREATKGENCSIYKVGSFTGMEGVQKYSMAKKTLLHIQHAHKRLYF